MTQKPRTIFYTDDDDDDRFMFRDALRHVTGEYNLALQHNGNELLQLLENPPPYPYVLFLDLNMPVKDGFTILREIREKAGMGDLPVIIFSTSSEAESIKASRQLGANLYIPKPSSFDALKAAIRYALSLDWKSFSPTPETFVFQAA